MDGFAEGVGQLSEAAAHAVSVFHVKHLFDYLGRGQ